MTEKEMMVSFIESLPKRTKTRAHYEYVINLFKKSTEKDLSKITQEDVLAWKRQLEKEKRADKTISNYISVFRSLLKYHYGLESVSKIKVYNREFKIKEVPLTPKTLQKMYRKAKNLRDELILRLLAQTGVRLDELLSIQIENIDFDNKRIKVVGKGRRERYIGLFYPTTLTKLQEFIKTRRATKGKLFRVGHRWVEYIVKYYCKEVGMKREDIAKISPHAFRHFFAMEYLNGGGRLEMLQKLLGHKNIATTSVYLSYMPTTILQESEAVMRKIKID